VGGVCSNVTDPDPLLMLQRIYVVLKVTGENGAKIKRHDSKE
jgi:hypothetical protein